MVGKFDEEKIVACSLFFFKKGGNSFTLKIIETGTKKGTNLAYFEKKIHQSLISLN